MSAPRPMGTRALQPGERCSFVCHGDDVGHGFAQADADHWWNADDKYHCKYTEPERWRTGRSVGRTLYLGDKLVGLMDTPELATKVVAALNATACDVCDGKGRLFDELVLEMTNCPACTPDKGSP